MGVTVNAAALARAGAASLPLRRRRAAGAIFLCRRAARRGATRWAAGGAGYGASLLAAAAPPAHHIALHLSLALTPASRYGDNGVRNDVTYYVRNAWWATGGVRRACLYLIRTLLLSLPLPAVYHQAGDLLHYILLPATCLYIL